MSAKVPQIDRKTAAKINPIISSVCTEDTLNSAASATYELGYIVTETELSVQNLFHVFSAIAAALRWEGDNLHSIHGNQQNGMD